MTVIVHIRRSAYTDIGEQKVYSTAIQVVERQGGGAFIVGWMGPNGDMKEDAWDAGRVLKVEILPL